MTLKNQKKLPSKRATVNRRFLLVAATIAALLFIGGIILALHWPFSSQNVIESIQQDWPGTIKVGRFYRTYFPHPGCVVEDVSLTRGPIASAPPLVTIKKVTLEANYHDLLLQPGYIYKIVLEGLKISVPADDPAPGKDVQTSNQSAATRNSSIRLGEVFTRDAVLEIATKSDGPLKFEIHELKLQSITNSSPMSYDLAMRNALPPGEIHSRGKLGPWDSQHLDNIPLSGNYTFDKADLGVFDGVAGTLAARGEFHGVLGHIETQGSIDIPDFEVTRSQHQVPLKTKFNALVDGTGGDTVLRSVDATFLRTSAHVEGSVASKAGQSGKTVSLNIAVRDGHIDDVLRLFVRESKPPMEGKTNFHAHVNWQPGHGPFVKKVVLQGEFDIQHAQWEKPDRQASLNMLSKRASGNKNDKTTDNVTAEIKGNVVLSDAVAKFRDTTFQVPGLEATMHGNYNLENAKIDFTGSLKTDSAISNEVTGAKAVLLKPLDPLFKRKRAGAVVPVAVTGTYYDPHFGLALPGK
jgi:hypothetical protein